MSLADDPRVKGASELAGIKVWVNMGSRVVKKTVNRVWVLSPCRATFIINGMDYHPRECFATKEEAENA